jgi:hypothetical protein
MVSLRSVRAHAWLVVWLASCAQGYDNDPLGIAPRPSTGIDGIQSGRGAGPGQGGAAAMGASGQAGAMAAYTGESCMMGETAACMCSGGLNGSKTCRFDRASPTMGSFSECGNCAAPDDMQEEEDDPGDVMSAGTGGAGGRAGGGSGRGAAGGASGAGGSPAGGSAGSGSDRPGGGTRGCMPACNNTCFPVGILPCCTALGTCGCTWAPGAYCF